MNLISFEQEQIEKVLQLLGVENYGGYVGKCNSCGMKLYAEDIGTIAKGKDGLIFYCEDADCFARQLTKDYLESSDVEQKESDGGQND
jgi:hypothetical protein